MASRVCLVRRGLARTLPKLAATLVQTARIPPLDRASRAIFLESYTVGAQCSGCGAGQGPNDNYTSCSRCPAAQSSTFGVCTDCAAGEVPNAEQLSVQRVSQEQYSTSGDRCVCDSTRYNSSTFQIVCHDSIRSADFNCTPRAGALRCLCLL